MIFNPRGIFKGAVMAPKHLIGRYRCKANLKEKALLYSYTIYFYYSQMAQQGAVVFSEQIRA